MAGNGRRARPAVLVGAGLALATATTVHVMSQAAMSSYGTATPTLLVADLLAGWALIGSGSLAIISARHGGLATLLLWLGIAWLSADWIGSTSADGWARIVAIAVASSFAILLLHSALTLPDGMPLADNARAALVVAYVAVAALALLYAFAYDPFTDPDCWRTCQRNPHMLISTMGASPALALVLTAGQLVSAALAAALAMRWLVRGSRRRRLVIAPVALPIALVSLAYASVIVMDWLVTPETPSVGQFATAYAMQAIGLVALALSPLWTRARDASMRRAVRQLTHPAPESLPPQSLAELLREVLADPTLTIAYPVGNDGRLVDAEGRPFSPTDARATALLRGDRVIAYVYHDPRAGGGPLTAQQLGAAAQLAVDNERLRADLRAQVEEVRASQARVIEASDAARSRLERDLHDGAQQRVLALLNELQRARERACATSADGSLDELGAACRDAESALAELRDIAHGIFPAILDDAGLAAAIETLRDVIDVPVIVERLPDDRFDPAVERAAYTIVAGALDASEGASATPRVDLWRSNGSLIVSVDGLTDDLADDSFERMATRVEALRGELHRAPAELRAVIPCG